MKYQQIKLQRPEPSPPERVIQQSIGQNFSNFENFQENNRDSTRLIRMFKLPQKLAISTRTSYFSTKTPDSPIENSNER